VAIRQGLTASAMALLKVCQEAGLRNVHHNFVNSSFDLAKIPGVSVSIYGLLVVMRHDSARHRFNDGHVTRSLMTQVTTDISRAP
jgi:hypothetical protein